jgi:hypothetical protein
MRPIAFTLCLGLVSLSVGCSAFHGKDNDPNVKPVARAGGPPKAEELVRSLNENAQRVRTLNTDVSVDGKFDGTTGGAEALLAYERTYAPNSAATPPNFRMTAKVAGMTVVELGSNSQEFFFQFSKAPDPAVHYCSYTDFRAGRAQMPFPIQPEWIVEALGVAEYDAKGHYTVKEDAKTYQLVETTLNPQGQTVYKVTSFSKVPSKNNQYPVISRVLLDSSGKQENAIYTAYIVRNQIDPKSGATLPGEVKLTWPKERIEMSMRLKEPKVNEPFTRDQESLLFSRQNLGSLPMVNLARGSAAPVSDIRQTGGINGGR